MNTVPPHRRDVAMVFQSYALYPHKTVYDNIAFGLKMRKFEKAEIDRRVRDAARRLEIEPLLERRPDQLSGGQRQRVALGRAMVRQPQVFLMDEPLSNLDAALRISMRAEIKQLHQAMQTTFVYVTHDQAEALTLADRIVVMRGGVVQQIGAPEAIYERPSNMFVASFLGNPPINFLKGRLQRMTYGLVFRNADVAMTLPAEAAQKLSGYDGREVVVGIRAEDVAEEVGAPDGASLGGRILSVLPVGSDQYLELEVAGTRLFFRVGKECQYKAGDQARLAINVNRLHVFDPDTTHNLLWA
jgi:multiple sugar transport system ATP-binding protein